MDDLFKEVQNPREKNLIQEARDLLDDVKKNCDSGKEILDLHRKKNEKLVYGIKQYLSEYQQKNQHLRQNFEHFQRAIENGTLIKNIQGLEFEDLFDVPVDATTSKDQIGKSGTQQKGQPSWFKDFKREEFEAMRENLEALARKMYKARMGEDIVTERDQLSREIDEMIEELQINYQSYDWEVPKEKLIQIEQNILKLMQFDMIIPQIIADVLNRASEFARSLYNTFLEFRSQATNLHNLISAYSTEGDRSMRSEFLNINNSDPERLRVKRYGVQIRNEELASLQEGRTLNEKILYFMLDYFHERNIYYKTHQPGLNQQPQQITSNTVNQSFGNVGGMPIGSGVYVMKSAFFEALVPPGCPLTPESVNYDGAKMFTQEYRGFRNTIFDRFARILIGVQITTNNWILVEIKNHPEKELLVYDSDMRFFAGYHERICSVIRKFIQEELRNKTELSDTECLEIANNYAGRTVASPQNQLPQDNAIYFAKNLTISGQGNNVHSGSYRLDNINSFRLELFTFLLRIGINVDRTLPFEILL
ncbi:hypothetical protein ABPG74_001766 [Tetrahymena malaccensis]